MEAQGSFLTLLKIFKNCGAVYFPDRIPTGKKKNLTTIADPWYFDRAVVFQRLINQSFYQEILLLQKFNDIGGKVLKPKKIQPPTSKKKMRPFFIFSFF